MHPANFCGFFLVSPYPQNVKFPPRPIFRFFCGPLASLAISLSHSHEFKFFAFSTSIHACTKDKVSCSPEKISSETFAAGENFEDHICTHSGLEAIC